MNRVTIVVVMMAALNVCTAVAVIYTKHLSRERYAEISDSQQLIDELDVQWSQLQIEESTFSEHGLVERVARDRLDMVLPGHDASILIARNP